MEDTVAMADTITMAAVTTEVLPVLPLALAAGVIMADMAAVITPVTGAEGTVTMAAAIVLPRLCMRHRWFMLPR